MAEPELPGSAETAPAGEGQAPLPAVSGAGLRERAEGAKPGRGSLSRAGGRPARGGTGRDGTHLRPGAPRSRRRCSRSQRQGRAAGGPLAPSAPLQGSSYRILLSWLLGLIMGV